MVVVRGRGARSRELYNHVYRYSATIVALIPLWADGNDDSVRAVATIAYTAPIPLESVKRPKLFAQNRRAGELGGWRRRPYASRGND